MQCVGKGIAEGPGRGWRGACERVGRWQEKAVIAGEGDNEDINSSSLKTLREESLGSRHVLRPQ